MTQRAAWLALLAWVAALILPMAAFAQYANLSVEPIDISALARMLREETGAEPADWEAFERVHVDYVARHAALVERSCKAIKASEGDMERQRGPSIELQLAQQELDGALFTAIAALMPMDAAEGIERVRVRRELAVVARTSGWLGQLSALDAAGSLQRVLRDDPQRWAGLKPEIDRHRRARRDLLRRLMRTIGEALECSSRSSAEQGAIWAEYRGLMERIERVVREAEQQAGPSNAVPDDALAHADGSGARDASTPAEPVDPASFVNELQQEQQAVLRRVAAIHNACWQSMATATASVIDHDVALYASLATQLTPLQRMAWRRSVGAALGVPVDRGFGVEQLAVGLLRAPGVDEPLRQRVLAALAQWAEQDGASLDVLLRSQGERMSEQFLMLQWEDVEPPAAKEFSERSTERDQRAMRARDAMQAMVVAQIGEEAAGTGIAAIEQPSAEGQKAELLLGDDPEAPEVDEPATDAADPLGLASRARPTLPLLDRFIEACMIPDAQAESMRALLASHESIVSAIAEGELAAVRGQEQVELMERVRTMTLGDAMAAVDEYVANARAVEAKIHDADAAFWTALGEFAGEAAPDFAPAMRVSAGLSTSDHDWAVVTSPLPGDPVRVALGCAADDGQLRSTLAAAAAAAAADAASRADLSDVQTSMGLDWLRGSLLWRTRADVSDDERAAFGEAGRVRTAEQMERLGRAMERRDALRSSLALEIGRIVGAKDPWPFRRALAAQAAPNGFRDRQRILPVLDALLADTGLPGGVRADVLGLKDDLEPELRRVEERLIESMDALVGSRLKSEEWIDRTARTHETLWIWWQRDEIERRCAERLRRVVPESLLPDSTLRPIREVERGRYGV